MTHAEKEAAIGAKNALKYTKLLDSNNFETPKARAFYEKHKGNKTFVLVTKLVRGVSEALRNGKQVRIEIRKGKKGTEPKLTRIPHRALRPGTN